MALLRLILGVVIATATFNNIPVFAQETWEVKIPQRAVHELYHTQYHDVDVGHISSTEYEKIDSEFLRKIAESEGTPLELASKQHGDIRDWLIEKAREYKGNQVTATIDDFAATPLGNISQQCYDDVMKFFTDLESLQPYAMKSKCWKFAHFKLTLGKVNYCTVK